MTELRAFLNASGGTKASLASQVLEKFVAYKERDTMKEVRTAVKRYT